MSEHYDERLRESKARGLQQITRIPPFRPGMWIRIPCFSGNERCDYGRSCPSCSDAESLSGKVRRIRTVTCAITEPDGNPVWRLHFDDGRCLAWHRGHRIRIATASEVRHA